MRVILWQKILFHMEIIKKTKILFRLKNKNMKKYYNNQHFKQKVN